MAQRRGLQCQPLVATPAGSGYDCNLITGGTKQLTLTFSGPSPTQIDSIEADAIGTSPADAAAWLGEAATIPYKGSRPDDARQWASTLAAKRTPGQTTIGAVNFEIAVAPDGVALWRLILTPS